MLGASGIPNFFPTGSFLSPHVLYSLKDFIYQAENDKQISLFSYNLLIGDQHNSQMTFLFSKR